MKILYLDIETSPNLGDVWGLWNVNISLNQLRESSRIICFSGMWEGQKKPEFYSEFKDGRGPMLAAAYRMLEEADVVIHYNGKSFDIPTLNGEFVTLGWGPPAPFQQIDLYRTVKKNFRFPSHKLAYVSERLEIGSKVVHEGHGLWTACLKGDAKAWKKMEKYNKQDVVLLKDLYDILKPWITDHPNYRLSGNSEGCPNCEAVEPLRKQGFRVTQTGRYQRYLCAACGTWSTDTRRVDGTNIRTAVL